MLAQRVLQRGWGLAAAVYPLLAAAIGIAGWSGEAERLVLLTVVPAVIARRDRATTMITATAYYLAANRDMVRGAAVYFDTSIALGIALWIVVAIVNALPWALLSTQNRRHWWRVPFGLFITAVPPFGIVGLGHPITAAGILFPGWGFLGIAATVVLMIAIALHRVVLASALIVGAALTSAIGTPLPTPSGKGINTQYGGLPNGIEVATAYADNRQAAQDVLNVLRRGELAVVVLPESTAGLWTVSRELLWYDVATLAHQQAQTVAVGAQRVRGGGGYENGVMLMGRGGFQFAAQRIPIPIAMWRPWANDGAAAHWFADGIVRYGGARMGYLICYEQFLVWPVVLTAYGQPDVVIGMANMWWAKGTDIPYIQSAALTAWARLFRWPVVTATNF